MSKRRRFSERELDEQVRTLRIIGVLGVGAVIVAAALWLAGVNPDEPQATRQPQTAPIVDPLQAELLRCNGLGQPALDDAACRRAWAENRRRFFGSANRQPRSVNERRAAPLQEPTR